MTNDYIYSFAGMFPKDDPEIIIYAAVRRPNIGSSSVLSTSITSLMQNIAKYKNMFTDVTQNNSSVTALTLDTYTNKYTSDVTTELASNNIQTVVIGNGDKIHKVNIQTLAKKSLSYDKVFLITNGSEGIMPDLTGYSRSEAIYLLKALNINYELTGLWPCNRSKH